MRKLLKREKALFCPYCEHGAPYVKESEVSKELARLSIYGHIEDVHPGKPVYSQLARGHGPFRYDSS